MSIKDKFSSENPYILPALLQTAQTNQSDLQIIGRESDQVQASSVFFRQDALVSNPANANPLVSSVAQQTVGVAISDGTLSPDGEPIPRPGGGGFNPIQE